MIADRLSSVEKWQLVTAAYFVAIGLGHFQFSLWLVRHRQWGDRLFALADFVPAIAAASAIGMAIWLVSVARRHPRPYAWIGIWAAWCGGVVLVDRYLTFSLNETVHYPQYALLAWLIARCLDPERNQWRTGKVIFWTTLLGIGDESMQYLWITSSYSEYLDFNDFLVNLLAAGAGVLIYYARAPARTGDLPARRSRLEMGVAAGLTVCLVAGVTTGHLLLEPRDEVPPGGVVRTADGKWQIYLQRKPGLYARYNEGPYRGRYWVLDPLTGSFLILVTGIVFAAIPPALGKPRRTA